MAKNDKSEHINHNLEETGKLLTQSKAEGNKKKIIIIAAVALIAVILIGMFGIKALNDKKYDEQVAVAEKVYFEGDYEQAEQEYLKAVNMNERKTKAREGLAYVYAVEGKFDQACETYTELYEDTGNEIYKPAITDTENEIVPDDPALAIGGKPLEKQEAQKPEVVTEMNDEMKTELMTFLYSFQMYRNLSSQYGEDDFFDYDCSKAAECGIIGSIIGDMSMYGLLDIYGDTGYEKEFVSEKKDPLGKGVDEQIWAGYTAADAERINWIAENIFNASKEEINKEIEHSSGLNDMEGERMPMYLYEGKYYRLAGYKGDIAADISIDDISVDGDYFIIKYKENFTYGADEGGDAFTYIAKMQYKIIDGKGYWSMYTREKQ
jgi:tetratricopeptide (TPR) repeat protein